MGSISRVTIDDQVCDVHQNESAYVPINSQHRLENPGKIPLKPIEVQFDSHLAENDIVRIEDNYQRKTKD